ncbi:MAG: flagellar basal-body rod protein FlgF [Spirochaetales bacterium]|nr:flagellar basal-body rod protein FlgF [Spirochaetales bacterium]
MVRGIYTGASGMMAQMHKMDALSNNLANVNTTGYKKDTSIQKAFPELLLSRINDNGVHKFPFGSDDTAPIVGKLGVGVEYNESFTVFEQGALQETSNPFDLALEDSGFFAIETPYGERYTRNGSFTLGKEGLLLTKEGYPVLGEEGPIYIKKNNFVIDSDGNVFQNGALSDNPQQLVSMESNDWAETEKVDTIKLVDFEKVRHIKKTGSSLWASTEDSGSAEILKGSDRPRVSQGFLEASNVNPVNEMVNLITVNRAYEANQKVISTQDTLTGKLFNNVARV